MAILSPFLNCQSNTIFLPVFLGQVKLKSFFVFHIYISTASFEESLNRHKVILGLVEGYCFGIDIRIKDW